MEKLTDLEICKKIAEIHLSKECYSLQERGGKIIVCHQTSINMFEFDPINDNGLCFELMVKYKIKLEPELTGDDFKLYRYVATAPNETYTEINHGFNVNPNKAICLAIIKAH